MKTEILAWLWSSSEMYGFAKCKKSSEITSYSRFSMKCVLGLLLWWAQLHYTGVEIDRKLFFFNLLFKNKFNWFFLFLKFSFILVWFHGGFPCFSLAVIVWKSLAFISLGVFNLHMSETRFRKISTGNTLKTEIFESSWLSVLKAFRVSIIIKVSSVVIL